MYKSIGYLCYYELWFILWSFIAIAKCTYLWNEGHSDIEHLHTQHMLIAAWLLFSGSEWQLLQMCTSTSQTKVFKPTFRSILDLFILYSAPWRALFIMQYFAIQGWYHVFFFFNVQGTILGNCLLLNEILLADWDFAKVSFKYTA